jgi:hypothetical protein
MQQSDNLGKEPANRFILLEKRDVFGNQVLYKVNSDLTIGHYVKHPDDVNTDFRKQIFGEMLYHDSYPIYYSTNITFTNEQKESLFANIRNMMGQNNDQPNHQAEELFLKIFAEYYSNDKAKAYYKEDLLKVSPEECAQLISMRKTIDNERAQKELQKRVSQLENTMNHNVNILSRVIAREELTQLENEKLEIIYKDAYSSSLYKNLRIQLNAIYLASMTISSGMVGNQKRGAIGKVGDMLNAAGGQIPIIGAGIQFFASILSAYDEKQQEDKIKAYANNLVPDSTEMAELSRKISLRIVSEFKLKGYVKETLLQKSWKALSKVGEAVNTAIDITANIPKLIAKGCITLKEKMNNALNDGQPSDEERIKKQEWEAGEKDAGILLKVVLEAIYNEDDEKASFIEKLQEEKKVAVKADLIVNYVAEHYKIPKKGIEIEEIDVRGSEATTLVASPSSSSQPSSKVKNIEQQQQPKGCCVIL